MKKRLFLIFISFCLSTVSFGQNEELMIVHCDRIDLQTYRLVITIKNHSLLFEESEKDSILNKINPEWVKSITVIKEKNIQLPTNDKNSIILVELKRRKWKVLPKELQERFENASSK